MLFQPRQPTMPIFSVPSVVFTMFVGGSEKSRFADEMRMQTWRWTELAYCRCSKWQPLIATKIWSSFSSRVGWSLIYLIPHWSFIFPSCIFSRPKFATALLMCSCDSCKLPQNPALSRWSTGDFQNISRFQASAGAYGTFSAWRLSHDSAAGSNLESFNKPESVCLQPVLHDARNAEKWGMSWLNSIILLFSDIF